MLLNCGVGEDSWESLGLQRDPTSPSLKEISPECSLEGLMLKLKLQYFGHLMRRTDSFESSKSLHSYYRMTIYLWIFVVVQLLSHVQLFANPWTAACQASLSITISWSLLKLISLESVRPSNHLILCCPLLLPPLYPFKYVIVADTVVSHLYSYRSCQFRELSLALRFCSVLQ